MTADLDLTQKAKHLLDQGHHIKHVAEVLGVPRSTLYDSIGRSNPASIDDHSRTAEEYRRELVIYADQYADINVRAFGDPPLYRSALAQKRRANGDQT